MTRQGVSEKTIDDAYRLFLGRSPNADVKLHFPSMNALVGTLINSKEFKDSPQARKNKLPWPDAQHFICRDKKVIYCPIGKNACTFFKQAMVKLAEHPYQDIILHSVHRLTDRVNTGMQLSDYDIEEVETALADPDQFKFAILRDPLDRLLSAYIEKFVKNREENGNLTYHTSPVIRAVQTGEGLDEPDYARGISFRSFVDHIVQQPHRTLDPHWRPQYLYLGDHDWTRLYTFDTLPQAVADLERISRVKLSAPPANRSGSGVGDPHSGADRLLPCELDELPMVAKESFLTPEIRALLMEYYEKDYELIREVD